ncbi:MAG: hypothetical protein ACRD5B_13850 [Nitrososphaeraceae archaeon]
MSVGSSIIYETHSHQIVMWKAPNCDNSTDHSLYLFPSQLLLSTIIIMMIEARCGHLEEKIYADVHNGLCRKCHSNFTFLLELEQKYGEDALIEYWYSKILTYLSPDRKEQDVDCLIDHLIEFYQQSLIKYPSKKNYIKKVLYMLYSLREPFDIETLK